MALLCPTARVKLTLTEEMLGSMPNNKDIYREFIARKAGSEDAPRIEDEVSRIGLDEAVDKGITVFPRDDDGDPALYDYQLKGFFKDSIGFLRRVKGSKSSKIKAYKKIVDGNLFIAPRLVKLRMPEGAEMGRCVRPLRASTPQGERVALAESETVPAGTVLEFDLIVLNDELLDVVRECFEYGALHGLGQWRNSGKGRFTYEMGGYEAKRVNFAQA